MKHEDRVCTHRRHGCAIVYVESSGGQHLQRPVLYRMVEGLPADDEVLVVNLERLSQQADQARIVTRHIKDRGATGRVLDPETLEVEVNPSLTA